MSTFSEHVVTWQRQHGRHALPWQNTHDPYRIWLSEIMLQQTQVATVIPYYERFLEKFPTVADLARAPAEDVMQLWAGLGYYTRARNLHACAQQVLANWGGQFPPTAADIETLPGIGRSTAAAIAAFAYGERSPILDGNVKRVFARHFGIEGDPSKRPVELVMWGLAGEHLPAVSSTTADDMRSYTQGLMDLGATVCTRGAPDCGRCPVRGTCVALREARQHDLPTPKVRKKSPERETGMLVVEREGCVLLKMRPSPGIWGGLWSLPEFPLEQGAEAAWRQLGVQAKEAFELPVFSHTFTHFKLHVTPWHVRVQTGAVVAADAGALPGQDAQTRPDTQPELNTQPGLDAQPSLDTQPGVDAQPGLDTQPGVDAQSSLATQPGLDSDRTAWWWMPVDQAADAALPAPVRKLLAGLFVKGELF